MGTQRIDPVAVAAHGLACAAGVGLPALAGAVRASRSCLQPNDWGQTPLPTWIGRIPGLESTRLPPALRAWDCRATRAAWLALQADGFAAAAGAAVQRFGATRVGLVLGTSASTIGVSEQAYRALKHGVGTGGAAIGCALRDRAASDRAPRDGAVVDRAASDRAAVGGARIDGAVMNRAEMDGAVVNRAVLDRAVLDRAATDSTAMNGPPPPDGAFPPALRSERLNTLHAVTAFVQEALGLHGPAATISTACSSSAKAFAQAERWLRLRLVDAVVVGGVDALSDSLLFGFNALQLVSPGPCRPFDAARNGISVGEAAGFALLLRGADTDQSSTAVPMWLLGHGEANDAHHMSSPHPQALGAELALKAALARAGLQASDVGYLNLHGTASVRNDSVEAALVARQFGTGAQPAVHASATKGATGHTMGAAGIVEALFCLLALRDGLCAGSVGTQHTDPALGERFAACLQLAPAQRLVEVAASNSFGFGGNNCVLVFGRSADGADTAQGRACAAALRAST